MFKSNWTNTILDAKQALSCYEQVLSGYFCRSSNRNQHSSISGTSHDNCSDRHNIRFSNDDIEGKKERKGFFSESRSHSKEIGELISKAFGKDSQLFGRCQYNKGELERENPHSPSLDDVVLAEDHLQKGYSEVWDKKVQLENEVLEHYNSIENIIKHFEETIDSSIPDKFKSLPNYDPEIMLVQPIYYQKLLYDSLFREINKHLNEVPPSLLTFRSGDDHKLNKNINGRLEPIKPDSFYVEPYYLADGERTVLQEFWNVYEGLRTNEQLVNLVKDYNDLQLKLSKMDSNKFHNDIDTLCKNIKERRTNLEGSCEECPKKNPLELFFG